jgi:tetratricopeptide (TPR) repeat protein
VPSGPPRLTPGLLAPGYEKSFYKGLRAFMGGDSAQALAHFQDASRKDARDKAVSDELFAGCLAAMAGDAAGAIPYLESVVSSDVPLPDELMHKYCPGLSVEVGITERVRAQVEMGSLSAALILAECYERVERKDEAIGLLQRLLEVEPDPALTLSLCELYADAGEWDEIVEVAAGVKNEDDLTLEVCLFQAQALIEQGMSEAALEVFRDALRARDRDAQLLKAARYGRGRLLLTLGKAAQGRKDLARVYADDPKYLDVTELLGGPPASD